MTPSMVLGRFHLIEKVDTCAAAASYTATNSGDGAWIDLLSTGVSDAAIQRLKDQRTALAKLKRARTPELIEFGEAEQRTFVAMRRPPGETLAIRIRRGGMGAVETLDLLIELAEALAETHALGITHGHLSEKSIFFATGGKREEVHILGFGLAGLDAGVTDQPTAQGDLRALGKLGYACLCGSDDSNGGIPAKVLEKRRNLSKETRDLVLRLLEGEAVESAGALVELAKTARTVVTTDIAPIKPQPKDAIKIEVVLRTTIDAAGDDESDETPTPRGDTFERHAKSRPPSHRASPLEPTPPPGMAMLDAKTLFIAGAILILLILGLWVVTSSGGGPGVVVESLNPE